MMEVEELLHLRRAPRRPFVVGTKVADMLGVVHAVCSLADDVLVGGRCASCFLRRRAGAPRCATENASRTAGNCWSPARHCTCSRTRWGSARAGGEVRQFGTDIPNGWLEADIGPGTAASFADMIIEAGTVFWNGPLGAFCSRQACTPWPRPLFHYFTKFLMQKVNSCMKLHETIQYINELHIYCRKCMF